MSIDRCPLCDATDLFVFVDRRGVPVHQNFPLTTAEAARATAHGDLRVACCRSCGFATNLAFKKELLQYGEGYENDQTWSPAFEEHVEGLVTSLVSHGIRGKQIIEVGCGQGQFLRRLCAAGANRGIGFDPSYVGPPVVDDGRVEFVREFYGERRFSVVPDLVLCRHVIEHVPAPLDLLRSICLAVDAGQSHATQFAFETPALEWILEGTVIQDFFYEHCSYFTEASLRFAFERAGIVDFRVSRMFGGQYLWATAVYDRTTVRDPIRVAPEWVLDAAARYRTNEANRIEQVRAALVRLSSSAKVAVWGAGAKGVTFLNLADPDGYLVDCIIDVNPKKQGRFVPGTGHAILPPEQVRQRGIEHLVVMNPNYADEIRRTVANDGVCIHTEAEL